MMVRSRWILDSDCSEGVDEFSISPVLTVATSVKQIIIWFIIVYT